jgi:hypothetical protein
LAEAKVASAEAKVVVLAEAKVVVRVVVEEEV